MALSIPASTRPRPGHHPILMAAEIFAVLIAMVLLTLVFAEIEIRLELKPVLGNSISELSAE